MPILLAHPSSPHQETEANGHSCDWCKSALRKLKEASPLTLKVSLRSVSGSAHSLFLCARVLSVLPLPYYCSGQQIREGRYQSLDQCLVREYRMSLHGISKRVSTDFSEVGFSSPFFFFCGSPVRSLCAALMLLFLQGVRARLVDKDYSPKVNKNIDFFRKFCSWLAIFCLIKGGNFSF